MKDQPGISTIVARPAENVPPLPAELLSRARALQPMLRQRADQAERERNIPAETIADFRRAGLFHMLRPRAFGGLESDPRDYFDVQNAIAEACASSAWVYGVLSVQYLLLVTFDRQAQDDVLGADPETLISSSFIPTGSATHAEGGYRLSGRWSYSSGCTHAGWSMVGAVIPPAAEGDKAELRLFLVPASDLRIDPVWDTFGLSATGSHDLVIEDVFVPAYRTTVPVMGLVPLPDNGDGRAPLHRLPWFYIFTGTVANLAIGTLRGALAPFAEAMRKRVNGLTGSAATNEPAVRKAVAAAFVEAHECETAIRRHIGLMLDAVASGQQMTMGEGVLCRAEMTSVARRLAAHLDTLQGMMGARGLARRAPLVRPWLDLLAARNHPGNDPAHALEAIAAELLAEPA